MSSRYLFFACCTASLLCAQTFADTDSPSKVENAQKPVPKKTPKKTKPHFAGVRRPAEKGGEKKPSSQKKNEWVKSKTHPKAEKKEQPKQKEEESAELPFFHSAKASLLIKPPLATSGLLFQEEDAEEEEIVQSENEGTSYPRLGKDAPYGHVFFTVDFLYWRTRQGGMEFAVRGASSSMETPFPNSTTSKLNFDPAAGFRVGFGVHLPNDGWDIYINYTDFRPSASKNARNGVFPLVLFNPPPSVLSGHAHWKIDFETLDIEIGRAYFIGKTLSFRPFLGMTGAWIDQKSDYEFKGGSIPESQTDTLDYRNDFKGAGPRIGVCTNWLVGEGLSLFCNGAAALIVGHFDLKNVQHQASAPTIHLNSDLNLVSPTLQLIAGLAWDRNFHGGSRHVGLSAGFETQYWWDQNQMERFTDSVVPTFVRASNNLGMYGLTLKARFDF